MTRPFFTARDIREMRRNFENSLGCTLVFKLKDGSTVAGGPIPCSVEELPIRSGETEQGARATANATARIRVPLGTDVKPHYRPVVTYPDGSTQGFFVTQPPVPTSPPVGLIFTVAKVD